MNLGDYHSKYAKQLLKYAELLTGDPDEAHDLVQETFETAIEHPYDPTKGKGVYGYLILLMRSMYGHKVDKLRSLYTHLGNEINLDDLGSYASYNPWPSVIRAIELRERLEKMEPQQQQIALLFIEGYTINEIMEKLPVSRSTIYRKLKRVCKELGI